MNTSVQQINEEWENLPKPPPTDCLSHTEKCYETAVLHCNRHLNRYQDVLPFESTRVKLNTPCNYINASYIELSQNFRCIAAQAPLPQGFNDFWQMVWESGVIVIVMLSRFIEKRRVKAHCYWPSAGQMDSFGHITVCFKKIQNPSDGITIQHFTISNGTETRNLIHIHYTNWPDFGVPDTTDDIREIKRIAELYVTKESLKEKKNNDQSDDNPFQTSQSQSQSQPQPHPFHQCTNSSSSSSYPILVHCSAGIGRAGTFLAFLYYCQLVKSGLSFSSISVATIVSSLREKRMCMVQTKEQYLFIYNLLYDEFDHSVGLCRSKLNLGASDVLNSRSKIPPPLRSTRSYCIESPRNFLRTTQTNLRVGTGSFSISS